MTTTYSKLRLLLLVPAYILVAACTDDASLPQPEADDLTTVPVTLTIGGAYGVEARDSRSAPPGATTDPTQPAVDGEAEAADVNTVRIVAFRREAPSDEASEYADGDDADFVYDPTNDQTASCARAAENAHRLTARGTLKKLKGYEYRVVALAYSTKRTLPFSNSLLPDAGEEGLFTLNLAAGTTLAGFQADLTTAALDDWKEFKVGYPTSNVTHSTHYLSGKLAYAPQLFFGECTSVSHHRTVRFREWDDNDSICTTLPLTGVLYRGMAKVDVTLAIDKQSEGDVQWLALLANQTRTTVGLHSYDAFLSPTNPVATTWGTDKEQDTYTVVAMAHTETTALSAGSTVTLTAWMLPTATRLALRVFCREGLLIRHPHNYAISAANLSSAEQGTGIISPDVDGGTFMLRRNQRYRLSGTLSTLTSKKELESK